MSLLPEKFLANEKYDICCRFRRNSKHVFVVTFKQNHVMERSNSGPFIRHHPLSVDAVTSPTSATSTSLSDILVTKRSSWPRVVLHPSTADDVAAAAGWPTPARSGSSRHGRPPRSSRRARSSSPYGGGGRSVDDGWTPRTRVGRQGLPVDAENSPGRLGLAVYAEDSCWTRMTRHGCRGFALDTEDSPGRRGLAPSPIWTPRLRHRR